MERIIEDMLDDIGLIIGYSGYEYLKEAILLKNKNNNIKLGQLYEIIAKQENEQSSVVERAIRTILEASRKNITAYFNVKYKLTIRRILALLQREVKRRITKYD